VEVDSYSPGELRARAFFGVALGLFLWLLVIVATLVAAGEGSVQAARGTAELFLVSGSGAVLLPALDGVAHLGRQTAGTALLHLAAALFGSGLAVWLALVCSWRALFRVPWWGHAGLVIGWCLTNLLAFLAQAAGSLPS
jgi:hypothetical protein